MDIQVFCISDLEEVLAELSLDTKEYFSSFTIKKNPNVQDFFRDSALSRNKEDVCRTFVVLDLESGNLDNIIGYFSLTITYRKVNSDVSNKLKKKISSSVERDNIFSAILITKLGRSDKYKGIVEGREIMNFAMQKCHQIYELTGLRHICVDYYNNEILEDFYLNKVGFKKYQIDVKTNLNCCFYKF